MIFFIFGNSVMFVMGLAYLCVGSMMLAITLAWKTSVHTGGIAGPRVKLRLRTLAQAVASLIVAIAVTGVVYLTFCL